MESGAHFWKSANAQFSKSADTLAFTSPDQLAINSISHQLRKREVDSINQVNHTRGESDDANAPATSNASTSFGERTHQEEGQSLGEFRDADEPTVYKRYTIELRNRSVVDLDSRSSVWRYLSELRRVLDSANSADHQLIDFSITLTTAQGHEGELIEKAAEIGARTSVEIDDF